MQNPGNGKCGNDEGGKDDTAAASVGHGPSQHEKSGRKITCAALKVKEFSQVRRATGECLAIRFRWDILPPNPAHCGGTMSKKKYRVRAECPACACGDIT